MLNGCLYGPKGTAAAATRSMPPRRADDPHGGRPGPGGGTGAARTCRP